MPDTKGVMAKGKWLTSEAIQQRLNQIAHHHRERQAPPWPVTNTPTESGGPSSALAASAAIPHVHHRRPRRSQALNTPPEDHTPLNQPCPQPTQSAQWCNTIFNASERPALGDSPDNVVPITPDARTAAEKFSTEHDRELLTILFTDLVDSTKLQSDSHRTLKGVSLCLSNPTI